MKRKKIGQKLRELRLKNNMTLKEVAKKAKVSYSSIVFYEQGKRIPRDEVKIRLCKIYNSKIEDIFF